MASPASMKHQSIGGFLVQVLGIFVKERALGVVLHAPFSMRLTGMERGREPDLLFVSRERAHLLHPTFLDGAADLAIEILSPESLSRDRGDKFVEYESAGVKEYWLFDSERQVAEFYELSDDNRYHLARIGEDGIYHSQVIEGFWLRVDWLWQSPLPPALDVLRELKII